MERSFLEKARNVANGYLDYLRGIVMVSLISASTDFLIEGEFSIGFSMDLLTGDNEHQ